MTVLSGNMMIKTSLFNSALGKALFVVQGYEPVNKWAEKLTPHINKIYEEWDKETPEDLTVSRSQKISMVESFLKPHADSLDSTNQVTLRDRWVGELSKQVYSLYFLWSKVKKDKASV